MPAKQERNEPSQLPMAAEGMDPRGEPTSATFLNQDDFYCTLNIYPYSRSDVCLSPTKLLFAVDEDNRNLQIVNIWELTMESPIPVTHLLISFYLLGSGSIMEGEERVSELEGHDVCCDSVSSIHVPRKSQLHGHPNKTCTVRPADMPM